MGTDLDLEKLQGRYESMESMDLLRISRASDEEYLPEARDLAAKVLAARDLEAEGETEGNPAEAAADPSPESRPKPPWSSAPA